MHEAKDDINDEDEVEVLVEVEVEDENPPNPQEDETMFEADCHEVGEHEDNEYELVAVESEEEDKEEHLGKK